MIVSTWRQQSASDIKPRRAGRRTVQRGLPPVLGRGVPLLGPLPVSVAMVAVTPVRPPAQGDVDPDVQGAVACGITRNTSVRKKSSSEDRRSGDVRAQPSLDFGFTLFKLVSEE